MHETLQTVETGLSNVPRRTRHSKSLWIAVVLVIFLVAAAAFLVHVWPFTEANVIQELQRATSSTVQFGSFRRTFFPHLGCVAENVTFRRGDNGKNPTVMTVKTLTIETGLAGALRKHVSLIRLQGAHAVFAPFGTGPAWTPTASSVVVDELDAHGALLEFTSHDPGAAKVQFHIRDFVGHHLATPDPMQFELQIRIPTPPGEAHLTGSFGPWNMHTVTETPVSGRYTFQQADLSVFGGIQGILSSEGKFQGPLDSLQIDASTATPDFQLKSASHRVGLNSAFHAQVDATNGDVTLNHVRAQLLRTILFSSGSIRQRRTEDGKTTALDFAIQNGRIQDLMLLFVSAGQAPLNGTVNLKAKALVLPGDAPFLKKLRMSGDFGIDRALFTKQETQENVEKLSAAGRGDPKAADPKADPKEELDPGRVVSDLQGHATVDRGVATFSDLHFRVPGARAKLQGTYDLISHRINLHGTLFMDAQLPKATSGVKSFLLKAVDPFLKKNRRGGAEFPIRITGTYEVPAYSSDPV